jgi:hypothetical protein
MLARSEPASYSELLSQMLSFESRLDLLMQGNSSHNLRSIQRRAVAGILATVDKGAVAVTSNQEGVVAAQV